MRKAMHMAMLTLAAFGCLSSLAVSQELPQWVKKLKLSGDVGLRTEVINDEKSANEYDRVRERARFRLALETSPVDKVNISVGIETSGTNPTSGWTDFTDFQDQPLYLAHAYMQYAPSDYLTVSGGKLKNNIPYWKPTQLIWKNDVNPYGAAANIKAKLSDKVSFFTNTSLLALTEYRDNEFNELPADRDKPMNAIFIVQPGLEAKQGNFSVKGAFAMQQFSLVNHDAHSTSWIRSSRSYTLINPNWDVSLAKIAGPYGVSFSGEFSHNVNSSADGDTNAYLLQVGFGDEKLSKFKTWQVKAAYRRLETNAIPVGFGQTSAYNADPGKGWECFLGLGLLKDLAFNATFYNMTDLGGNRPQLVSQFDLIYKF